uniref:Uncharacterized protein n=1 Tax=Amphimedon queenslandica TaxID=400682 RepID=A0A1X7SX14_AMPQE
MSAKIPESQSKNITQLFAYIYDDLVSILKEDCDLLICLIDSLTYNLLRHLVDKEKILQSSHSMGCKMLTNAVLTYLNRARHPDHSISNLLHIFENYKKLKPLVHKIRERAEIKLHTKICNVQLPLLEVQDNEARIHQPLPSVLTLTKDQTNVKLRSSFRLPPDPKLFLAVVSDFIPLDRFSLKGESPIGETSPLC